MSIFTIDTRLSMISLNGNKYCQHQGSLEQFSILISVKTLLVPQNSNQSAHFNKNQYSLHCAVGHHIDDDNEIVNAYYYHLSNDNTHDWAFTGRVIDDLISSSRDGDLIRLKSDNCGSQYKSKKVFNMYCT